MSEPNEQGCLWLIYVYAETEAAADDGSGYIALLLFSPVPQHAAQCLHCLGSQ